MDAWKVFCLALTAFPFTLLHHTKILLDVKKFALFFFPKVVAPRANNVPASRCWLPSIRLYVSFLAV